MHKALVSILTNPQKALSGVQSRGRGHLGDGDTWANGRAAGRTGRNSCSTNSSGFEEDPSQHQPREVSGNGGLIRARHWYPSLPADKSVEKGSTGKVKVRKTKSTKHKPCHCLHMISYLWQKSRTDE